MRTKVALIVRVRERERKRERAVGVQVSDGDLSMWLDSSGVLECLRSVVEGLKDFEGE